MTLTEAPPVPRAVRVLPGLDVLRGSAIVLMVVDHVCLLFLAPHGDLARVTVTRLAMPLFFLVAGALVRRLRWRHVGIFAAGLFLPSVAWWVDQPNVLCLYVAGAVLLVACRRFGISPVVVLVTALTVWANNWWADTTTGYNLPAALSLMALGQLLGGERLAVSVPDIRWLAVVGRYPLTVYLGHVLVFTGVAYLMVPA